jgi:hypothetical protein
MLTGFAFGVVILPSSHRQLNPPCLVKGCSGDFMEGLTVVFTMKHPSSSSSSSLSYTKVCDNKTTVLDPNNDNHKCLKFNFTHFGEGEVKHTGCLY